VELAIAVPILALLMLGAVDFGRVYYHALTTTNAAGTAAFYGSRSNIQTGHFTEMTEAARQDARDAGAVTATAERFCQCPDGAAVDCVTGGCAGYGAPRVYVRCRVRQTFPLLVPYPGMPRPTVGRVAVMRAQ
jgi:Flp pilus assembly protein TadG